MASEILSIPDPSELSVLRHKREKNVTAFQIVLQRSILTFWKNYYLLSHGKIIIPLCCSTQLQVAG